MSLAPRRWTEYTPADAVVMEQILVGLAPNGQGGFSNVGIGIDKLVAFLRDRNPVKTGFTYANDPTALASSMVHAGKTDLSVGDSVTTQFYNPSRWLSSNGRFVVAVTNGVKNTSTVGKVTNGGSLGLLLEGEWHRFAFQPLDGMTYQLRPMGVACLEGVYGWQSRFDEIAAFVKYAERQGAEMEGPGVLSTIETVYLDRVKCHKLPRFQAAANFYAVAQRNDLITFEAPFVIKRSTHGLAANSQVTIQVGRDGTGANLPTGALPSPLVDQTTYFVTNPTTDTYELAATAGGPSIAGADLGSGIINQKVGTTVVPVTLSLRADFVARLPNHGLLLNQEIAFGSTGKVHGNMAVSTRCFAIPIDANTFKVATSRGGAAIVNINPGAGTQYLYRSPYHAHLAFGAPSASSNPYLLSDFGFPITNRIRINGATINIVAGTPSAGEVAQGATGADTAASVAAYLNANKATFGIASATLYKSVFVGIVSAGPTIDAATETTISITKSGHGLAADTAVKFGLAPLFGSIGHGVTKNQAVTFSTTGTMPEGLVAGTTYYASDVAADFFSVAAAANGISIPIFSIGSGVISLASVGGAPITPKTLTLDLNGAMPNNVAIGSGFYVRNPTGNTYEVSPTAGGVSAFGSSSGSGRLFQKVGSAVSEVVASRASAGYSVIAALLPQQSGIDSRLRKRWDGKIISIGYPVRAASNGSNQDWMQQQLEVWGDGDFSLTTKSWNIEPTCGGVIHEGDDSSSGMYRYSIHNVYTSILLTGASEKHALYLHTTKCRWAIDVPVGSSMDSLNIEIHANDYQGLVHENEGVDCSGKYVLAAESRCDPARDVSPGSEGADCPTVWGQGGKCSTFGGFLRAINGLMGFLFWGKTNGTGASWRSGADSYHLDALRLVHGNCTALDFRALLAISGDVFIKNWYDPFTQQSSTDTDAYLALGITPRPAPCVRIGRLVNGKGLRIHAENVANTEGLHVGYYNSANDNTLNGPQADGVLYQPVKANLGSVSIKMGAGVPTDAGLSGSIRADRGIPEFPRVGWRMRYMIDCQIDVSGGEGNGVIEAGVQGPANRVIVGHEFLYQSTSTPVRRYTITKSPAANCEVGMPALTTTGMTVIAA